ncbi:amidohydrolase family protein [Amycolatopsis sp. WGS_07]|uniref:amidohydrolase family protein n=1 Tax=Amycolatopsis sp. WGS_07 TaxID=3076764 RepID=UPI003872F2C5
MRIITLEEHFSEPALTAASAPVLRELGPGFVRAYSAAEGNATSATAAPAEQLEEIGEARIADMDRHGITTQVLSGLWGQQVPADVAPELARRANDTAAAAVAAHPGRFAAFATLGTAAPEAAATELDRCVSELGFVGTLITGRTEGEFLDAPRFAPVLAAAARLRVPIYLHPGLPPRAVTDASYAGLDPVVTARFQAAAWGWHVETATHFVHLVLSGVFDRHPELQVILGHWGEMIPFYLDRLDDQLPARITGLDRSFAEYFRENAYITPSGMFSLPQLRFCLETIGADRILHSVDYPFVGNDGAAAFLTDSGLSTEDQHRIAHGNAEKLLGV